MVTVPRNQFARRRGEKLIDRETALASIVLGLIVQLKWRAQKILDFHHQDCPKNACNFAQFPLPIKPKARRGSPNRRGTIRPDRPVLFTLGDTNFTFPGSARTKTVRLINDDCNHEYSFFTSRPCAMHEREKICGR